MEDNFNFSAKWRQTKLLEREGKTFEQMINIARELKPKQTPHASKEHTTVESLKRKRMEPGTTSTSEYTEKREKGTSTHST